MFGGVTVALMSEYIHKSHNVSVLIYHLVCPAKYRRVVFGEEVDAALKEICLEIAKPDIEQGHRSIFGIDLAVR